MVRTESARRAPYPLSPHQRRCGKCGKLVSRAAYECRRCGKRQRVRPRTLLLGLAACLLAGMFAFAGAGALSGSPRAVDPAAEVARTAPAEPGAHPGAETASAVATASLPAASLTAVDLWMEYARDPAGADRRFRDRPVVVSGMVRAIDRDFDGRLMVRLSTGDTLDSVNAKLAMRDDPAIARITKGKTLSLGCVGRGALIGAPLLGSCSVL